MLLQNKLECLSLEGLKQLGKQTYHVNLFGLSVNSAKLFSLLLMQNKLKCFSVAGLTPLDGRNKPSYSA